MSHDLYADLAWLPAAPADFRQRCRALAQAGPAAGNDLVRLATHALNENQLGSLAAAIAALRAAGTALSPLVPFKLGVTGNATLEPLVPALVATAARHGIALECVTSDYGQTAQEALSPDSRINRARPDAVLLALDYRGVPLRAAPGDAEGARAAVRDAIAHVDDLRAGFRRNASAPCIVQTLAPPAEPLFGAFDARVPGSTRNLVTAFNAALIESLADTTDVLLDVDALAQTVGLANWHAPRQWHMAKLAFGARLLPLYAEHVCRVVGAMRGKSRRCLILDLDNTLWGGVIGDDGLEGIVVGEGSGTGEAYLDVQRAALALRERGVVLAVSSKNEDAVARAVFRDHPEMLLREHHLAAFQANWRDKATNISAIARDLALGLDAMVFLDDNPVERGLVRDLLPQVAVPELPDDPALYARTLAAAGYFEAIAFSSEDRKRAEFYTENARRLELKERAGDVAGYLASLGMRIAFRPFDATGRSRITQLINKSNQFNLTTKRYGEADVAALGDDPGAFTLQVRLVDKFGDNGMIGVVICRARAAEWEIDTWLMSCRVLGRGVEEMTMREILHHARERGIARIVGTYVPTERNAMVRDHYAKLGFERTAEHAGGATAWVLATSAEIPPGPMTVERSGFEPLVLERS